MKTNAFGTSRSPRWTTLRPTQLPTSLCTLCKMCCIMRETLGADCSRFRPWPVSQRRYRSEGSSKSSSVHCQSANMLPMISRHNIKLWSTNVNCVLCPWDRQEPPRPRLISRLQPRSSFGLKYVFKKVIIRSHGSRLNLWNDKWSLIEAMMVSTFSSVITAASEVLPRNSSPRSPAAFGAGAPATAFSAYFSFNSLSASLLSRTSACTSARVLPLS
mmetsp:Transcript_97600/g.247988  ORF Transcript_97600/g.247988 Transcript_97600/m.247988 type:complete len:216 (-) Transcript_97600:448-1095(-)